MAKTIIDLKGNTIQADAFEGAGGTIQPVEDKTQIVALTALATDADLPTAVLKINAIIAALKA